MERAFHWFLVLTACASFIIIDGLSHSSLAAAENYEGADRMLFSNTNASGFISIDCGSSEDYWDDATGFRYQTDEKFVEAGYSLMVPGSAQIELNYPSFGKRLKTLRCFPKGERNCYTLRPEQGNNSRYLIRAFFSYGNYDGKNQTQSFDLYLGVNLWDAVSFDSGTDYHVKEIIHTPSSDSEAIQVCLVKTRPIIPCIAALELRPLNSSLYNATSSSTPQPLLILDIRIDVGVHDPLMFSRYKDDVYDRVWRYDTDVDSWPRLRSDNSTYIDHGTTLDAYRLPAQVWRTAGVSRNVSSPLQFDSISSGFYLDQNTEYYVYFHFTEIKQLPAGQKRIIDRIALNSDENILPQSQPLVLEYLKPVTISGHTAAEDNIIFSISAAADSDAPPILNAFEIYKSIKELASPTDPRDAAAIVDIKGAYQITWLNWQGDPCRPVQYVWEGLTCTSDTNPRITSLNLRSSNLKGVISNSLSYLTELKFLDLSNNDLEGPLPEFLAELPKLEVQDLSDNELEGSLPEFLTELPKLKFLNLTGNKLSGPIPQVLKEKSDNKTLQLSVSNNPGLCLAKSCNNKHFTVPLVASLLTLIVILLISLGLWIFKRRQKVNAHTDSKKGRSLESKHRTFTYTEILNITDNFKTIIGEGGFGKVYLGILQDHAQVAVKLISPSSTQGYREFQSEAQLLSLVHHRNLVTFIGYCDEGEIKALIYEYMTNGNLQRHLSVKNQDVLKWNERLNIAIDAGLDYLHNGVKPSIVHRDLKTSNILLDQAKHAKIADFGLSRAFGNDIDSHISTCPAGTPGYIDPEFHRTGNLNKRSDVYSFGIILFELITGQPAVVRACEETTHILQRVKPIIERGDIQNLVDPRLKGEFNTNSAWKVVEIALSCCSQIIAQRPDISQIFVELKECLSSEMVGTTTTPHDEMYSVQLELDTELNPSAR